MATPSPPRLRSPEPMQQQSTLPTVYRALRPATARAGFARDSAKAGAVAVGEMLEISERRQNDLGQMRVRCRSGWLSVTARSGEALLASVDLCALPAGSDAQPADCPLFFRAVRAASVREGCERTSRRLPDSALAKGEIVEAVEGWTVSGAAQRWRIRDRGWVSETAANGSPLLQLLGRVIASPDTEDEKENAPAPNSAIKPQQNPSNSPGQPAIDRLVPPSPEVQISRNLSEYYDGPGLLLDDHPSGSAERPRRQVWETDPSSHNQAVGLHHTRGEMTQAAQDAAMRMIREAMASGMLIPHTTNRCHASHTGLIYLLTVDRCCTAQAGGCSATRCATPTQHSEHSTATVPGCCLRRRSQARW